MNELPQHCDSKLPSLIGFSRQRLEQTVAGLDLQKFRAKQLFQWIYHKGASDFVSMSNMSKSLRDLLSKTFSLTRPVVVSQQISNDGTQKWLLRFEDGNEAETVFIPDNKRGTLCISSQIGCTLTCSFCHTGTQRLVRNLSAEEIVAQIVVACDVLKEWPRTGEVRSITNIVFMGMGEPLYNTDNVIEALSVLSDPEGIAISKRRITVSTSGVVPEIAKIGSQTGAALAISLHATTNSLRDQLVPINRKYPLEVLRESVENYPGLGNSNRVTWEYVMLAGVNDSDLDAKRLLKFIQGIPSKVNLIPFNPWPKSHYKCSDKETIKRFSNIIFDAGYASPVRQPRGRDILAACGQLKSASERIRKHG